MKLHIGCGTDKKQGYINVDINPLVEPDVIDDATKLSTFDDGCANVIECYHLLEHLTQLQAFEAFTAWNRVLKVGGELIMELPNLARCIFLMETYLRIGEYTGLFDTRGYNLAMVGIYGYPPDINKDPQVQQHRWGWTPDVLKLELWDYGFENIVINSDVDQKWRKAYKLERDMRVTAIKRV